MSNVEEIKDSEEKDLVLKGTVVLDSESMNALQKKIRKEIVEEIKDDGYYTTEITKFMEDLTSSAYFNIIQSTISSIINKTSMDDLTWSEDKKKLEKLILIQAIMEI